MITVHRAESAVFSLDSQLHITRYYLDIFKQITRCRHFSFCFCSQIWFLSPSLHLSHFFIQTDRILIISQLSVYIIVVSLVYALSFFHAIVFNTLELLFYFKRSFSLSPFVVLQVAFRVE